MGISNRLKHVADLVSDGYRVADIGTDHGYVPICLLKSGRIPSAIAVDISAGSLEKARENARRLKLQDVMECRLGDGLHALEPGEADTIVICGMGGILMRRILEEGKDVVLQSRELILSPHRNPELILEFLEENHCTLVSDEIFPDKKKQYRIIKAVV